MVRLLIKKVKKTGIENSDGLILNADNGNVVGEVVPESVVTDLFGNYTGYADASGGVRDLSSKRTTFILPGGASDKNLSVLKRGVIINYGGRIIGSVLPDGAIINTKNVVIGKVYPDGKAVNKEGRLIGEIADADIVINNQDKVVAYVGFDGTVRGFDNSVIGRVLSGRLAVNNQNIILGMAYKTGTAIVSNDGKYLGRLAATGRVISGSGKDIGYLKSNGSFVDLDKNVSGYALQEVAQNRRN